MTTGLRRGWLIAATLLLLLCLFMMWQSWMLRLVDRLGPGPGFFPFWLAAIGAVLAAVVLVQTLRRGTTETAPLFPRDRAALGAMAAIVGCTALAAAVMLLLGFRVTILLFAIALPFALGGRRWLLLAPLGLALSFGVFHVFNNWLDVILPQGLFESLLGL